jgi:tetratricopeptide (TPR) repeat protein
MFNIDLECKHLEAESWPRAGVEAMLVTLPSEDEYHPDATCRYVTRYYPAAVPALHEILADDRVGKEVRYHALIGLATYLANSQRHSELRELLTQYKPQFRQRPRLQLLINRPDDIYPDIDAYTAAIGCVEEVLPAMHDDPSALCHYCELVLNAVEDFPELASTSGLLSRARQSINRAIRIDDYPKYHAALARILSLEREWPAARTQFRQAIATEDPSRADYEQRVLEYRRELLISQARQSALEVGDRVIREAEAEIKDQIDSVRRDHLTAMALFAALVTFVITGAQVVITGRTFSESVQLLVVLAGAWISIAAAFSLLFGAGRRLWLRAAVVAGCGLAAIILGITVLPELIK